MKNKGNKVFGSIYQRRGKGRASQYTAEIQFHGQKVRRSSKDRALLESWMSDTCGVLNELEDEYQSDLELRITAAKTEAWQRLMSKAKPILDDARQHDLLYRVAAERAGLCRVDHFRTYLIRDEVTGATKIGKTHDLFTRMRVMCNPNVQLVAYAEDDHESFLHEIYRPKRIKGEWYNLTERDVNEIVKNFNFVTPGGLFRSGEGRG